VHLPFDYLDGVLHISMGAAFFPGDAEKADKLFAAADEQRYPAKKADKRCLRCR